MHGFDTDLTVTSRSSFFTQHHTGFIKRMQTTYGTVINKQRKGQDKGDAYQRADGQEQEKEAADDEFQRPAENRDLTMVDIMCCLRNKTERERK